MRHVVQAIMLAGLVAMAAGCVAFRAPVVPPTGWTFNETSAPLDLTFESTDFGSKQGKASVVSVLGLFSFGDATIGQAARNGNIKTVKHADSEFLTVLYGLVAKQTTVVYGD